MRQSRLYVPGGDLKAQLINAKIRTPGVSGREPTYTTAYIELIFTFYRALFSRVTCTAAEGRVERVQ
ncbi:hypothetical protein QFZ94_008940 [Paraburkholderia sp. JPY465]|uniref:hypothetical protein n=1 Tax=Paraburkholderia sp. JPY465 TaxID=3042285 RepID=UPI003D1D815A